MGHCILATPSEFLRWLPSKQATDVLVNYWLNLSNLPGEAWRFTEMIREVSGEAIVWWLADDSSDVVEKMLHGVLSEAMSYPFVEQLC